MPGSTYDTCACGSRKRNKARTCRRCYSNRGPKHGSWKGGTATDSEGYVRRYAAWHPRASSTRRVYEHILVMESHLGRLLHPGEEVHHRNGVRDDNRIENLELWSTSHPAGQRVVDLVAWAHEILEAYE